MIEAEARGARAVFNSEPGRASGNVVSRRKGGVFMVMRIAGKAAHSGGNFTEGISAIEELARKIVAIHALTDVARGVTLNVGLVSGGQSVNTVAPWAEGQIDLRYIVPEDRERVMAEINAIVAQSFVPGNKCYARDPRRVPPAHAGRSGQAPARGLCRSGGGERLRDQRRILGWLRRFRIHRRRRRADDLRGGAGRRQGPQPRGVPQGR